MKRKRKYDIYADTIKNRLHLVLFSFLDDVDLKDVVRIIRQEVKKLNIGFDMICDISEFRPISMRGANEIKRAFIFLKKQGLNRIVVVQDFTLMSYVQFEKVIKDVGCSLEKARTIDQATRILDTLGIFIP